MDVLNNIVREIEKKKTDKAMLVCVDGVDTAGKTTFADKLGAELEEKSILNPVRVSIDKFHNSNKKRLERGPLSPEGFYYDSFNYEKVISLVLEPVKNRKSYISTGIYDYRSESEIINEKLYIDKNSVLIMDGIFMLRPEIIEFWDISIFLEIDFNQVLKRALKRDLEYFGSEEEVLRRYNNRYIPGEKIYLDNVKPSEKADIVIDNNDFDNRKILKI